MSNKFFTSKFFYILTSIFFAIVLFFNASATSIRNDGVTNSGAVYTATISNVPIELKYNDSNYFVSSTISAATVHLSGYNRLQLANEENADTRNFYLSIDLNDSKKGTTVHQIKVENLPTGVSAQVDPASTDVTIEPKATHTFEITPKVDNSQIPAGFSVNSIDLSEQTVEVTAGQESISKIHAIEADLPSDVLLTDDYTGKVVLRAVDEKGKTLPAQLDPSSVRMKVNIDKLPKEVPINIKQKGTLDSSLSSIKLELSNKTAKIYGEQSVLNKIDELSVPLDITGVKTQKTVELSLHEDNVTVRPRTIQVVMTPVTKK